MNSPPNINSIVVFDPLTNTYLVQDKIGTLSYGEPKIMSFSDYQRYSQNKIVNDWRKLTPIDVHWRKST